MENFEDLLVSVVWFRVDLAVNRVTAHLQEFQNWSFTNGFSLMLLTLFSNYK